MRRLVFKTVIDAPVNVVFDLARSVDAHMQTTSQTGEFVISGKASGILE